MNSNYLVDGAIYRMGSYRHRLNETLTDADHADLYERLLHAPHSAAVEIAYTHFKHETIAQYRDLLDTGLTVVFHYGDNEYPCSTDMLNDLRNGHLFTRLSEGDDLPGDHPMSYPLGKGFGNGALMLNDIFRAVHDALGHGGSLGSFGVNGEKKAWIAHRTHYSSEALPALWCETRGQSAWTNAYGDHASLPLKDRPFAQQKAGFPSYLYI